ncbi:hypothetical protein HZF07_06625 [Nocardioides sp. CGMCC 1.13656]|uniref:DUF6318 family protein n=1 Tax=Nocardioides TaxID=1839 RepID=UPI0015EBA831|nr:DUF6318 family protein [Nocardioides sp. CGMCC 1.13656]MBA2953382.1 hypothetical protein [Nocardioides sp. CGMCC 1.13656]
MNRARAVLTALVLVSALGLAGCTDDDPEPKFAPPSSEPPESQSTTGASDPTPPEMPQAAKGTDAAAAEAFVKFYWETVNFAQATGDVEDLSRLSTKCVNCDNGIEFIKSVYSDGGTIDGGDGKPTHIETRFTNLQGEWWAIVDCTVALTPQDVDASGTEHDEHYAGGQRAIRMYLQPSEGSWVVRTMSFR